MCFNFCFLGAISMHILAALEFALILMLTGALTYVIRKKKANSGKFKMSVSTCFYSV